jgi:hypothetical protein
VSDLTEGTVSLPGIGPTKKIYVIVGGAGIALVVAYMYYRHAQAASANDTTDTGTGEDYAGTGTDGSDAYSGAYGSISGTSGSDYYDSVTATPTTDQEWVALVEDYLNYLEQDYLVTTLGKYLDKKGLTADEAATIRSAWAVAGHPPGNQSIILATDSSSPGTVTTPDVPTGLKVGTTTSSTVPLSWTAVSGATKYRLYGPDSSVREVTGTSYTVGSLASSKGYTFRVSAVNSAGESAKSASVTGTTKTASATSSSSSSGGSKATYHTVTVKKFTEKNPPWQSTISGIAGHYGKSASTVWNYAKNASLRAKRGSMSKIQPGDKVYVPA